MKIRKANESDLTGIELLLPTLGYAIEDRTTFLENWRELLSSQHMGILVAAEGESILGYLAYSFKPQLRHSGKVLEIDELVISDSAQGKGLGTKLVLEVQKLSQEKNIKLMVVSTNRKRESYARGFYQKLGFKEKDSALLAMTV